MFTGLVEAIGVVRAVASTAAGRRLEIDLGAVVGEDVRLGDSISVSGCCQTVAALSGPVAAFEAVPETLGRTTLGGLKAGDRVNLERSLAVGGRMGGHFVQGHIDGLARLTRRGEQGGEKLWVFEAPKALLDQIVPKGSIAVDGVSLTLAEVTAAGFSVALIPTTLDQTTLGDLKVGQAANIETDILGKYILKALGAAGQGLTVDKLREAGFLD
ncbi:MAG: riboflavin synthase [Anaerolineaceae bacterium]|nr:riboflavin synthase [Anaerolineaceae bacterium]